MRKRALQGGPRLIPAPAPGLYRDVSAEVYHSWDAVNASLLRKLRDYPPAQVRWEQLHPADETPAMTFGTLLHTLILEQDALEARYAIAPKFDKRTNAGKAAWAKFELEALAAAKTPLREEEFDKARRMRNAAWKDPFVRRLLDAPGGINEGSVVWIDTTTGLPCKMRFDRLVRLAGHTFILDIKTAASAQPERFSRVIEDKGYHCAAEWYTRGLEAEDRRRVGMETQRTFLWIVLDKDEPHLAAVYQPDPDDLADARHENNRLLNVYSHCRKTDTWPGYTPNGQAMVVSRPRWARRRADSEEPTMEINTDSMEIDF